MAGSTSSTGGSGPVGGTGPSGGVGPQAAPPGFKSIHRLNNSEYNATVGDVLKAAGLNLVKFVRYKLGEVS